MLYSHMRNITMSMKVLFSILFLSSRIIFSAVPKAPQNGYIMAIPDNKFMPVFKGLQQTIIQSLAAQPVNEGKTDFFNITINGRQIHLSTNLMTNVPLTPHITLKKTSRTLTNKEQEVLIEIFNKFPSKDSTTSIISELSVVESFEHPGEKFYIVATIDTKNLPWEKLANNIESTLGDYRPLEQPFVAHISLATIFPHGPSKKSTVSSRDRITKEDVSYIQNILSRIFETNKTQIKNNAFVIDHIEYQEGDPQHQQIHVQLWPAPKNTQLIQSAKSNQYTVIQEKINALIDKTIKEIEVLQQELVQLPRSSHKQQLLDQLQTLESGILSTIK